MIDIHVEIDDGFVLCGGNPEPRVRLDRFIDIGKTFEGYPQLSKNCSMQRCPACVDLISSEPA
jgi:hypothetical protein